MPRVVKHPDVRRDELLDVAFDAILTTGFTPMSVEQVTTAAGVAKGTFYYYFASKDDLLEQLVRRFGDQLFDHLTASLARAEGTGLQRLQAFLAASASWKLERVQATSMIAPFIFTAANLAVRYRLLAEWTRRTHELVEPLIERGHDDGSFAVGDVRGTTGVILTLWTDGGLRIWDRAINAPDEDAFIDELIRGSIALSEALERILGAPTGALTVVPDRHQLLGLRDPFLAELNRTRSGSAERSLA